MSRKITVSATQAGLNEAAEWLLDYKKKLTQYVEELLAKMLNEGEEYALNAMGHIDTGLTSSTIAAYRNGNKGVILAGGNAIWIEFGTGVLLNGVDDVHDRAALGIYEWGTFDTINDSGVSKGANANGWYYKDESGTLQHTLGIPMNPFMYNTAKWLAEECPEWAKEIFSK